jgi:hypothetical protein
LERVHLGRRRADRPSPTVDQTLRGGFPWLEIECSRCRIKRDVSLAELAHIETTCCSGRPADGILRRRHNAGADAATCTSAPSPGRTGIRARTGRRSGNGLAASIRSIATNTSEAIHGNLTQHAPAWPGAHGFGRAVYTVPLQNSFRPGRSRNVQS